MTKRILESVDVMSSCEMPQQPVGVKRQCTSETPQDAYMQVSPQRMNTYQLHQQLQSHNHIVATPEALYFLQKLARCSGNFAEVCHSQGGLNELLWYCFAELNIHMEHFPSVSAATLKGYHSFTKMPKATLWTRFAQCEGLPNPDQIHDKSSWPAHLKMAFFILDKVFQGYQDGAIVKYTLPVPRWLHNWCLKWGYTAQDISIVGVHAYAPASSSSQPIRQLYVPVFNQ